MTKIALFVGILACALVGAGDAQAKTYELRLDPSGAPMCFALDGDKAPLDHCQAGVLLELDPSGAPMCFTASGDKAPLTDCKAASAVYVSQRDPSGAPMCFTAAGDKAPLSQCEAEIRAASLSRSPWIAGIVSLIR